MLHDVCKTTLLLCATAIALIFFGRPALCAPSLLEWRILEQTDTLDIYYKDRVVGTLIHGVLVADSAQAIVSTMSMSVGKTDAGMSEMEVFEQRMYGVDGRIHSARQIVKSPSGTNTWDVIQTPQGWRLSVTAGGETNASIVDSVIESLLPTLDLTKRVKKMLVAKGDTWRDTQLDLVSGKLIANSYLCTAVDSVSKVVSFDVADNMTGRRLEWQIDSHGKTLVQEIEGMFVAKRAPGAAQKAKRKETTIVSDLGDLLSVPAARAAGSGERIALVLLPPDATLDASVGGLYVHKGDRWILNLPQPACSCVSAAKPDSALGVFTRPTPTLQSNHPLIVQLARKIKGNEQSPCAVTLALTRHVFSTLEKRPTATFSNALETLKAGFGDCGEHAVLLAALLRSLGIPARVVLGLYYDGGKKAYAGHAWVMVWTGSWVFADPAFGVFPACKDRVPLVIDDSGRNSVLLARLLGRIKVEYVSDR